MQVNGMVNAANFLAVGNQTGNSTQTNSAEDVNFASFLSSKAAQPDVQKSVVNQVKGEDLAVGRSNTTVSDKSGQNVKNTAKDDDSVKPDTAKTTSEKDEPVSDNMTNVQASSEKPSEEDVTSELEPEDAEWISGVIMQIMDYFNLSLPQLQEQLEAFDMQTMDLLSEDGVKDFFLSMNNVDVSDLLTDENLNQDWNRLLTDIDLVSGSVDDLPDGLEDVLEEVLPNLLKTDTVMPEQEGMLDSKTQIRTDDSLNEMTDVEVQEPYIEIVDQSTTQRSDEHFDQQKNGSDDSQSDLSNSEASGKEVVNKEKSVSGFENPVLQAVESAIDQVENVVADETEVTGRDVIRQIVEQIKVSLNQDTTTMEMQLYPQHLGKIQIHVVSKDGIMTARIVAETEAAKQAIEGGLSNLKESMEHQNLKVDAIEVMVSTTGFEKGNEQQNSYEQQQGKGIRKKWNGIDSEEEELPQDDAEIERMKHTGSSVSYSA